MGRFRARDVLLVPSLVSLLRLPLAALFALLVDNPVLALGLLLLAGASDVVDGWYARRFGQATPTGAVVDGLTDKLFMATVVSTLLVSNKVGLWGAVLLATRELGELPLVLWWTLHQAKRRARSDNPEANRVGKLCTVVQFVAVAGSIFAASWLGVALAASGALGLLAATYYWLREIRA